MAQGDTDKRLTAAERYFEAQASHEAALAAWIFESDQAKVRVDEAHKRRRAAELDLTLAQEALLVACGKKPDKKGSKP